MASLFPREEHAEALFHRILSNPGAEQQLYETFCMEQENASFEDGGGAECSFAKALLQAYENRDISALTIALCNNTMFDLLRTAYLIPYRFHGKNGGNPRLLTDANGEVREEYRNAVSARELRKFHDIYRQHLSVPRAALYLADGSHLRHKYTKDMQVREMYSPSRRGVLTLYALPDTVEQGLRFLRRAAYPGPFPVYGNDRQRIQLTACLHQIAAQLLTAQKLRSGRTHRPRLQYDRQRILRAG